MDFWRSLHKKDSCTDVKIEWPVGQRRADVFAVINGHRVAIELQYSDTDADEVGQKISDMTSEGVHTVYVILADIPASGDKRRLLWWKQYLHALCMQRLYFWLQDSKVVPVHCGRFENDPIKYGRLWTRQDYFQARPIYAHSLSIDFADFVPLTRNNREMISRHVGMPNQSLLWFDQIGLWWAKDVMDDSAATRWSAQGRR